MPHRRTSFAILLAAAVVGWLTVSSSVAADNAESGENVPPLLGEALESLAIVDNPSRRAAGLRRIAVRLASVAAADEALRAAGSIEDGETRATAMTDIAPILAAAKRPAVARTATRKAAAILIGFGGETKRLSNRNKEIELVRRLAIATAAVEGLSDALELLRISTVEFRRYSIAHSQWEPLELLRAQVDVAVAIHSTDPAASSRLLHRLMDVAGNLRHETWRAASLVWITEGWIRIGDLGQALRAASMIGPGGIPAKGMGLRWTEARRSAFDKVTFAQFGSPERFDVAALDFRARSSDHDALLLAFALERRTPAPSRSTLREMTERAERLEQEDGLSVPRKLRLAGATARALRRFGEPELADAVLHRALPGLGTASTDTSRDRMRMQEALDVLLPELIVSDDEELHAEALAVLRRHSPLTVARGWAALTASGRPLPPDVPAAWMDTAAHQWSAYRYARDYLDDAAALERARAIGDAATRARCLMESFDATRTDRQTPAAILVKSWESGC